MPATITSTPDSSEPILDRLARLYRPLRFVAVALTALTVGVGAWAAATLSDPIAIHWTLAADGSLVADRTAGPVVGSLLAPALAVGILLVAAPVVRLADDRAVGALAYGVAAPTLLALLGSELLLIWLNLG